MPSNAPESICILLFQYHFNLPSFFLTVPAPSYGVQAHFFYYVQMTNLYLYLLFAFGKLRYVSILFVQSNDKSNLPNLFKSSMLFLNIAIKSLLSLSPILPASSGRDVNPPASPLCNVPPMHAFRLLWRLMDQHH